MNIKQRTDTYGGFGCEGHPPQGYVNWADAEFAKSRAEESTRSMPGLIKLDVKIVTDPNTGRFWVEDRSTYDDDERIRLTYNRH